MLCICRAKCLDTLFCLLDTRILLTGYLIVRAGYRILLTGYRIARAGYRFLYSEYRILRTGYRILRAGYRILPLPLWTVCVFFAYDGYTATFDCY